jgi:uncharacterized RDD family membrane protein YckC
VSTPPPGFDPQSQQPPAFGQQPYGAPQQPYGQQQPQYGQPGYGADLHYQAGGIYTQVPGLGTVPLASMGNRFVARLIDGFVVGIPLAIAYFIVIGIQASSLRDQLQQDAANGGDGGSVGVGGFLVTVLIMALVGLVLTAGYEIVMIGLRGATLGKLIVHIRVVNANTGQVPGMGAAFARWGVMFGPNILNFLLCIGALLELLVVLSPLFDDQRRQGWHDKAAKTLVVSTNRA